MTNKQWTGTVININGKILEENGKDSDKEEDEDAMMNNFKINKNNN